MIKNLIFGVYLLISGFLVEILKANKNQQKGSLILQCSFPQKTHSFYEPQLTQHYKKYNPTIQPKTCFWLVTEKTFALHHFQAPKNYILGALGKQMSLYSHKLTFENFYTRDVGNFYLVEGGRLRIIFLRWIVVWDSQNVLNVFILIDIFGNSTISITLQR